MYILDVKTPGKLLDYRGKEIRTPAQFVVTDSELKKFKVVFRQVGVMEYSVRSKKEVDKLKEAPNLPIEMINPPEGQEVIIEEIMDSEEETKSVLDQLIKNSEKEEI